MNDDMLDYVLGLGNYKVERDEQNVHDYLFPFCFPEVISIIHSFFLFFKFKFSLSKMILK